MDTGLRRSMPSVVRTRAFGPYPGGWRLRMLAGMG